MPTIIDSELMIDSLTTKTSDVHCSIHFQSSSRNEEDIETSKHGAYVRSF